MGLRMGNFFDQFNVNKIPTREFNKATKKYIEDNADYVALSNRMLLIRVSFIIECMMVIYYVLSLTVFASWNVSAFYAMNIVINGIFLIFCVMRYWKHDVSMRETIWVSQMYQLYIMMFLAIISILPLDKQTPAVYFAPLGIVFAVLFIIPWRYLCGLIITECAVMIGLSYYFKSTEIFSINLFSTIVACFVFLYIAHALYEFRISESLSRSKLKDLAGIDKLTGLYNKGQMEALCLNYFKDPTENTAILILDVDHFKTVNDTFGHQQGDLVLKSFGKILQDCTSEQDLVGRIGGDEFMILLTDAESKEKVAMLAERIVDNTHKILSSELKYNFSCSIGIAMWDPEWGITYDRMFANADRALYQTKNHGKDGYTFFTKNLLENDKFKTILIVDPMRVSRSLLVSCLEGRFRVFEVNDGKEAVKFLSRRKTKIDSVIMNGEFFDYNMQNLLEYMKKSDPEKKKVCFFVKNANQEIHCDAKGLNVEYILKPFDPAEVLERVEKEVLGRFQYFGNGE